MAVLSYKEVQGSKGQVFLIPRLGLPRCHFLYILLAKQSQSQPSQRNEAQALTLMEGVARVYRVGLCGITSEIPIHRCFSLGLTHR